MRLGATMAGTQVELGRPLRREIGRLGAFEDFIHVGNGVPVQVEKAWAMRPQLA